MKRPSALVPVIAGFSVMLLLMAAVTAIGVTYVGSLSEQLTSTVSERNEKSELATSMRALNEGRYQVLMLASNTQDPFERDEVVMRLSHMAQEFIQLRDKFLALPLDEAELERWHTIRDEVNRVERGIAQVLIHLQADELGEAKALIQRNVWPVQTLMMAEWSKLVAMQRGKNQEAMAEARRASDKASRLTLALSAGAFGVGLIIAVFVVRLSRRLESALFEQKELAQVTLHAIGDAVIRFDQHERIAYLNPVAEQLLAIQGQAIIDLPLSDILRLTDSTNQSDLTRDIMHQTLQGQGSTLPRFARMQSGPGMEFDVEGSSTPIHTPDGDIIGGVLVLRDVTEDREMQRKLLWQADHDALTSLKNRRALEERLSQCLISKRASEFPLSVLYIDLDRFKPVNDSAGHAAGDELLRRIAHIMQIRIRDSDTLARMGGDEFAVLLTSCPTPMAEQIAHEIRENIGRLEFQWEGKSFHVGASIGIVHVPPHWASLDACLVAADAACYQAKHGGRDQVVVYAPPESIT